MRTWLLVLAPFVFAAACGNSSSGGNCKLGNVCEEYAASADLAAAEKDCKSLTGEWSKGTCSSSDLVGTCVTAQNQTRKYYSAGPNGYTKDNASANCEHEFHGTWTAK